MLNIFNYKLSINLNPYLLVLFILLAAGYVVFIYKNTIPQTSGIIRVVLITSRSLVLALILFLIFEPTLTVENTDTQKPVVPIFIDNSSSMSNYDSLITNKVSEVISKIPNGNEIDFQFYSFSDEINQINMDSVSELKYKNGITSFENIFEKLKNSDDYLTSAVILSDGIINDGSSSIYQAEELNFPVFAIGVGDTNQITDLYINSILNNRFIYKETPTIIAAEITNSNLAGETAQISFLENNQILETQEVELSESGINRVTFDYTPGQAGKQKITIQASRQNKESNFENNRRSAFIDVLENKLNILVIGGSPSADFSSVYQSLINVDEYKVNKFIQISGSEFIDEDFNNKLDSAELIVLINFPHKNTPNEISNKILQKIETGSIPVLNIVGSDLKSLQLNHTANILPFTQSRSFDEVYLAQPIFSNESINLIGDNTSKNIIDILPPIAYPNGGFKIKPGVKVIAKAKVNNIETDFPIILSQDNLDKKVITFIGSNFWRWKVNSNENISGIFNQLIYNSVQWLRVTDNQKKFYVETTKDIFAPGEEIEFTGELYDEKLEPVDNGTITVSITSGNKNYQLKLSNQGNGMYNGKISLPSQGDFKFSANAEINDTQINEVSGKFNIGEVDLEKMKTVMQENYLKMIASLTGGAYTYINNSQEIFDKIETLNRYKIKRVTSSTTYDPLSIEVFLILIVLLLSLEWFLRKREGML